MDDLVSLKCVRGLRGWASEFRQSSGTLYTYTHHLIGTREVVSLPTLSYYNREKLKKKKKEKKKLGPAAECPVIITSQVASCFLLAWNSEQDGAGPEQSMSQEWC